jgi:hypothetical protein
MPRMERPRRTPVENAEEAVRKAEEEFRRNPSYAAEQKLFGARNFLASVKERAAKDPGFNVRRPSSDDQNT